MKRHKSLQILSRQHHEGLILSQFIKKDAPAYKNLPDTTEGKISYILDSYRNSLQAHFNIEEKVLIPIVRGTSYEIDDLCNQILEEHRELANLIESLEDCGIDEAGELMDKIGRLLESHIHMEERYFFQAIQAQCCEEKISFLENMIEESQY